MYTAPIGMASYVPRKNKAYEKNANLAINKTSFKAAIPVEYFKLDNRMTIYARDLNVKDLANAIKKIFDESSVNDTFQGVGKHLVDDIYIRLMKIVEGYNTGDNKQLFISTNGKVHDSMYQLVYTPVEKAIECRFFTKDEDDIYLKFENGQIKHIQYSQSADPKQHLHPPIYRYNVIFSQVNGNTCIGNKYYHQPPLLVKGDQDQNIKFFHL